LRSAILLLVVSATMVLGALDMVQSLEFSALWPVAIASLAFAWLLAATKFPGWLAALLTVLSGFSVVFIGVGRLGEPLALFYQAWVGYARLIIQTRRIPSALLLEPAARELQAGLGVLFGRLDLWLETILRGETVYDPLALALVWGLVIWGAGAWAVWVVRRWSRPIIAGVPAIFVLGSSLAFVGGRSNWILPILAAILALTILIEQDLRELYWAHIGARVPDLIRRNVTLSALLITAGLVTAAYVTPSITVEDIRDFFNRDTEVGEGDRQVAVGVPSEEGDEGGPAAASSDETRLNNFRNGGLPTQHLIGSGPELSEQVVMLVRAQELQPELLALQTGGQRPDYYWRNMTFDTYSGRGWITGPIQSQTFAAGDLAITTSSRNQRLFRQQVSMVEDRQGLLYHAGSLVTADHDFRVAYRLFSNPDAGADQFAAEIGAAVYQAESLLPIYSEDDLRQTGQIYPEEIARRYLGLPVSVPDRVMQLALDLTATEPTAYDRALAIEAYLRTFPYTLDLPQPPVGDTVEIADYFLFTLRRGYCDYYATTMAVLARAAGLPARVVFGYIGGTYDAENDVYVVTEDQAHSWVEIYFPGYGWIEFEPTAGRPAIERRSERLPEIPDELLAPLAGFLEPDAILPGQTTPLSQINWNLILGVVSGGLVLLVLFVLYVWPVLDTWRLRLMAPHSVVSELFLRLYLAAPSLNMPPQGEKTPYEFSTEFARQFSRLLVNRRSLSLIETTRGEVAWLTDSFVGYRYGAHLPDQSVKTRAIHAWRRWRGLMREARWQAFRNRLRSRRRRSARSY
jgi:transglutaminase-like putative cysteine protease